MCDCESIIGYIEMGFGIKKKSKCKRVVGINKIEGVVELELG